MLVVFHPHGAHRAAYHFEPAPPPPNELRVAASAADVLLTATVHVAGTGAPNPYEGIDVAPYETASVASVDSERFSALLGRKLPEDRTPIDRTMSLCDLNHGRSPILWAVWLILRWRVRAMERSGSPNINILFVWNMPLRALGTMTSGLTDMGVVDAILREACGWGWGGGALLVLSLALGWGWGMGAALWLLWVFAPIVAAIVSNLVKNAILARKIRCASRAR